MNSKLLAETIRAHLASREVLLPATEIESLAEFLSDVFADEERTQEIPPVTLAYLRAESVIA